MWRDGSRIAVSRAGGAGKARIFRKLLILFLLVFDEQIRADPPERADAVSGGALRGGTGGL
ncbi:MAG: hypothetical protein A2Y61_05600 [Chloroflexi bacterium RBG_13_60_13]|nr:MAG: hypothetical protein A2Y61_05600 [Chloroflexi bacterium RBG_13_60_13]